MSDFLDVATEKPLQKGDPENGNMSPWEFVDWEKPLRSVNSFYTTSPGASWYLQFDIETVDKRGI